MLKWLLVLMALGVVWTAGVSGYSQESDGADSVALETSTVVLPTDSLERTPGRVSAWLFRNAESVPQPRLQQERDAGVLTAGLVSQALPARSGRVSKPWHPPASAVWLLAEFGALLLAVAAASVWWNKAKG